MEAAILSLLQSDRITGQLRSSEEGEVSWVESTIRTVDCPRYASSAGSDEDPDLSEYHYRKRTDDDWEKLRF